MIESQRDYCLVDCHKLDLWVVLEKVEKNITKIDINDKDLDNWYEVATSSRTEWSSTCHASAERKRITPNKEEIKNNCSVKCHTCHRQFRGECDKARHKCIEERQKPVNEQTGAVRCEHCHRLFRSKGGLLVHR